VKYFIALFITSIVLFKPLWPIVNYVINYDYIATVLCENKDKMELQCNGQCYLMKQLAKELEQRPVNPFEKDQLIIDKNELVYLETYSFQFNLFQEVLDKNAFSYLFKLRLNDSFPLLDPPPKI